jgi:RNA polymerase sigma-70 factor, ECF subfamily
VDLLAPAQRSATTADELLVRRAAAGDVVAFDALLVDRIDRCYRLAWSILANDADAADATQDAFVAVWRELPRLRDVRAFDGWLNRIVANAARMARRHRTRLREVSVAPDMQDSDDAPTWEPESVARKTETDTVIERDSMGRAFERLRPAERAILSLHYVDERPVAEIARTLNVPVGTAKWRLHAARKSLERAIEAEA